MKTKSCLVIALLLLITMTTAAQTASKNYFSKSSTQIKDDKEYGVINITADKNSTVILGTIMAYGENVKGLTIKINNGFPFKLAPAQTGTILNYVGPALDIVLQPGDKAKIEFIDASKERGTKQLYVSGEIIE